MIRVPMTNTTSGRRRQELPAGRIVDGSYGEDLAARIGRGIESLLPDDLGDPGPAPLRDGPLEEHEGDLPGPCEWPVPLEAATGQVPSVFLALREDGDRTEVFHDGVDDDPGGG